jgi:hypothetical protein
MDGAIGNWLIADFVLFGIHVQHWMVVAVVIVLLAILLILLTKGL